MIANFWLAGWLANIAVSLISHTDPGRGLAMGAIEGAFTSVAFVPVCLFLGLIGRRIGDTVRFRRYRSLLFVLFSSSLWIFLIGEAAWSRLNPERSLKRWTGVAFPAGAERVSYSFSGGVLADDSYTFVFSCRAEETEKLIRDLELSGGVLRDGEDWTQPEITAAGWVPRERWTLFEPKGSPDYIELITNSTRTKVCLIFGQI